MEEQSPIVDKTVYTGRPLSEEGRLEKELAVYRVLDELGISYLRVDHAPIYTVEGCDEIDRLLHMTICKNLFLCNSQKTKFYLLLMPGTKRFVTREFCGKIESPRLSFAPEEYMERFLDITPGSVSILGLMNDRENRVQLYIDEDVLKEEYLGCHPCINTSSLKLPLKDVLEKFLPYVHHDYRTVQLDWQ